MFRKTWAEQTTSDLCNEEDVDPQIQCLRSLVEQGILTAWKVSFEKEEKKKGEEEEDYKMDEEQFDEEQFDEEQFDEEQFDGVRRKP